MSRELCAIVHCDDDVGMADRHLSSIAVRRIYRKEVLSVRVRRGWIRTRGCRTPMPVPVPLHPNQRSTLATTSGRIHRSATNRLQKRVARLSFFDNSRREPTWHPTLFHRNPLKSFIGICVRELFGSSGSGSQLTHVLRGISSSRLLLGRLTRRVPEDQR
jgi:hypothetical protein